MGDAVVAPTGGKVRLELRKATTKKKRPNITDNSVVDLFGSDVTAASKEGGEEDDGSRGGAPLIIPVVANKSRFNTNSNGSNIDADIQAAKALTEAIANDSANILGDEQGVTTIPVAAHTNNNINQKTKQHQKDDSSNHEDRVYQKEIETLPPELTETDGAYDRVPIADFGAALLRGMGWQGENAQDMTLNKSNNKSDEPAALPRPHRLGLGAIPKPVEEITHRPLRPDEYDKRKKQRAQHQEFIAQHEQNKLADPQQTLQDGSLVYLNIAGGDEPSPARARIVKLRGVPGLNRIQIQYEGQSEMTIVSKSLIDRLVTRPELHQLPFQEPPPIPDRPSVSSSSFKQKPEVVPTSANSNEHVTIRPKKKHKKSSEPSSSRSDPEYSWMIPNIRVRVITKNLGKSFYKAKGIVVDVTAKGNATLQMSDGTILDRVPMRYVETALPKEGGSCIVVGRHHDQWQTKGRLLERNRYRAIIQESENGTALTIPLDDLAEWCGPIEET